MDDLSALRSRQICAQLISIGLLLNAMKYVDTRMEYATGDEVHAAVALSSTADWQSRAWYCFFKYKENQTAQRLCISCSQAGTLLDEQAMRTSCWSLICTLASRLQSEACYESKSSSTIMRREILWMPYSPRIFSVCNVLKSLAACSIQCWAGRSGGWNSECTGHQQLAPHTLHRIASTHWSKGNKAKLIGSVNVTFGPRRMC